jgi:hypothetical protein
MSHISHKMWISPAFNTSVHIGNQWWDRKINRTFIQHRSRDWLRDLHITLKYLDKFLRILFETEIALLICIDVFKLYPWCGVSGEKIWAKFPSPFIASENVLLCSWLCDIRPYHKPYVSSQYSHICFFWASILIHSVREEQGPWRNQLTSLSWLR